MTERRKRKRKESEPDLKVVDEERIVDDEEAELLAAAAAWAGQEEPPAPTFSRPKKLSLHITQIPYDCTELDIRSFFAAKGCAVVSVRMVYDETGEGRQGKRFRGVAFCDVADEKSYDLALKELHRSRILGRKVNVRPTRTREELSNIVERTKEIVTERKKLALAAVNAGEKMPDELLTASAKKKRKENDKKKSSLKKSGDTAAGAKKKQKIDKKSPTTKGDPTAGAKKEQKMNDKKPFIGTSNDMRADDKKSPSKKGDDKGNGEKRKSISKKDGKQTKATANSEKVMQTKKRESKDGKEKVKLTKQQRNRRAAILAQKRKS